MVIYTKPGGRSQAAAGAPPGVRAAAADIAGCPRRSVLVVAVRAVGPGGRRNFKFQLNAKQLEKAVYRWVANGLVSRAASKLRLKAEQLENSPSQFSFKSCKQAEIESKARKQSMVHFS